MTPEKIRALDWSKDDGLLPAIVQHARTGRVLMLGYMNQETLRETLEGGRVVFFSRSRGQRWLKGETSGHFLNVVQVSADCDNDTLLVLAEPVGPTCHKGTPSCFAAADPTDASRAPSRIASPSNPTAATRRACSHKDRTASRRSSARKAWRPRSPPSRATMRAWSANART